ERFKTAGLWAPAAGTLESDPARRRVSRSLAELAETVATLSHSLASQSGERGLSLAHESGAYQRRLRRVRSQMTSLERDCRLALKQSEGLEEQFRRVARKMSIVQFHLTDSDLIAFVHRRESVKAVRFPGGRMRLSSALGQWRFILEGELLRPHLGNGACVRDEENFFTELGDWLWRPLEIDTDSQRILVIPEGELANLPWEALRIDERSLGDSHDIVQSPSLRHFTRARSVKVNSDEINLFVGRADDLPAVERETKALSQRAGANGRVYRSCRRSDWPESGEYFIWHYSGHSHLRSDNPFYSFLALEDAPLFAADFRLRDARVRLVTLAACRAAEQVALPGEESTGLVRSLLEMGARNVIGGRWSVSDDSTALWMNKFYSALFEGNEISSARRLANRAVRSQKPSAYHWAAFAVYGAGD
ncbi:MAG: CHAT domain-containing protein, partial [Candidatus Zixiibacteriota bacterium]